MALIRYTFELYLGGAWVDITEYVRHGQVTIKAGSNDESPKLTPSTASLVLHNNDDRFNPSNPNSPYYGQLVRNTPLRITCADDGNPGLTRFVGEVFGFAPRWNEDRSNCTVPIEASGPLRRVISRKIEPWSYYRSWIQGRTSNPIPRYYWPLEEGGDAAAGRPSIGSGDATLRNAPIRAVWGQAPMNEWIPNGAQIDNLNTMIFPADMRAVGAGSWEICGLITFPANETVAQLVMDCGPFTWYFQVYAGNADYSVTNVNAIKPDGTVDVLGVFSLPPKDVGPIWFNFRIAWNGSAAQPYFQMDRVANPSSSVGWFTLSPVTTPSAPRLRQFRVDSVVPSGAANSAVTTYTGVKDIAVFDCDNGTTQLGVQFAATKGGISETTYDRFARLALDQDLSIAWFASGGSVMGRQYLQSLEDHFLEILASSKHSGIIDAPDTGNLLLLGEGFQWPTPIDYSDIYQDIEPEVDDQVTANIVQVNNSHGESVILAKDAGRMSVAEIGPFPVKVDPNNRRLSFAAAVAGTRLALGTWTGPRFPEVSVSAQASPALYGTLLRRVRVGDYLTITGMSSAGYFDDLIVKVLQIKERISHEDHIFTFVVRPGEIDTPNRRFTIGSTPLDVSNSTVAVASSGGTVDVNVPTTKWTAANAPFDVMISGERMTVTNVTTLTGTTQRLTVTRAVNGISKTVPVGAEVHVYPPYFIKAV